MSVTAVSRPNIAFTKYWGNRDDELRLPAADSLSMTLDRPAIEVTVDHADTFGVTSFREDGDRQPLKEKEIARLAGHLELTNRYLTILGAQDAIRANVSLTIRSGIPPAIGLASSAAVFSAVAKAYAGLIKDEIDLTDAQISVIARLGSGSAARSIFGGYAALDTGSGDAIDTSTARQIAAEDHWTLHDFVIAPSLKEKEYGSTEGHHLAHTSPHWEKRLQEMPRRQQECIDAILTKDFEKLRVIAEEDAENLHLIAETSTPSLRYLTEHTHRILQEIEILRTEKHLPVLYTMDAGPTVHLICTEEAAPHIAAFAEEQKRFGCTIFTAKTGKGAMLI